MGSTIALAGLIGGRLWELESALRHFAESNGGEMPRTPVKRDSGWAEVFLKDGPEGSAVVFPRGFVGRDQAAAYISKSTGRPTFAFQIEDSDLWMYRLFVNRLMVDQFCPLPDYWGDVKDRGMWAGHPEILARYVPGLDPATVADYLVFWKDNEPGTAYADDDFWRGDCWQLRDFMRRLGLPDPVEGASPDGGGVSFPFWCGKFGV